MNVSIVIPVSNRAHLVGAAIDSALAQTTPCEVIVVDHGSTDDIARVISRYGHRIRYIRRDTDTGPVACWLDGARHATGDYIHFTYDDDWIQPTFIERCIAEFRDDVAFVYTRATLHASDGKTSQLLRHPRGLRRVQDVVRYLLATPLTISPGCALFRREDVLRHLLPEVPGACGPYGVGSGVGEDLLLLLLTTLRYPSYVHVPEFLADFLGHEASITTHALQNGHSAEISNAYSVAKCYYLEQPHAVRRPHGVSKLLFRVQWNLRRMW